MENTQEKFKNICIFGGTFNPVHIGHVSLAMSVYKQFELDNMVIIPSNISPHKEINILDPEHRMQMAQQAFAGKCSNISISDYEINSQGISYTYKTLEHYRKLNPEAALFFLTGTDIFATIKSWKNWRLLFEYANFIVVNRKEKTFADMMLEIPEELQSRFVTYNNLDSKSGKIIYFEMKEVPVSSTEIRNDILCNKKNDFLPKVVYDYINKNNLYRGSNA